MVHLLGIDPSISCMSSRRLTFWPKVRSFVKSRNMSSEFKVGDVLEPVDYSTESEEVYIVNLEEQQREHTTFFRIYWDIGGRLAVSVRSPRGQAVVLVRWICVSLGAALLLAGTSVSMGWWLCQ